MNKQWLITFVVCLGLSFAASASAQGFGVSIPLGNSGRLNLGNAPIYGGYGGYGGYRQGTQIYVNPGNYQSRPSYQPQYYPQPQSSAPTHQIAPAIPQNQMPPVQYSGGPIVVANPKGSGQTIKYLLNGYPYAIEPGHEQKFAEDRVWTLTFGSGGTRGDLRYGLKEGFYEFRSTKEGWDLVSVTPVAPSNPIAKPGKSF